MNDKQLRELAKMKRLINKGFRKFVNRKDRDYVQELEDIGISEEKAWKEILTLSKINYVVDYKPFYNKKDGDALIFKKDINNNIVYIKLKIELDLNEEWTVCLSFHIDYK